MMEVGSLVDLAETGLVWEKRLSSLFRGQGLLFASVPVLPSRKGQSSEFPFDNVSRVFIT